MCIPALALLFLLMIVSIAFRPLGRPFGLWRRPWLGGWRRPLVGPGPYAYRRRFWRRRGRW